MNCYEIQEKLSLYIDNELDEKEFSIIHLHLKACPTCRRELKELQHTINLVRYLPAVELPGDFHVNLMHSLDSVKRNRRNMHYSHFSHFTNLVAGFIVFLFTFAFISNPFIAVREVDTEKYSKGKVQTNLEEVQVKAEEKHQEGSNTFDKEPAVVSDNFSQNLEQSAPEKRTNNKKIISKIINDHTPSIAKQKAISTELYAVPQDGSSLAVENADMFDRQSTFVSRGLTENYSLSQNSSLEEIRGFNYTTVEVATLNIEEVILEDMFLNMEIITRNLGGNIISSNSERLVVSIPQFKWTEIRTIVSNMANVRDGGIQQQNIKEIYNEYLYLGQGKPEKSTEKLTEEKRYHIINKEISKRNMLIVMNMGN